MTKEELIKCMRIHMDIDSDCNGCPAKSIKLCYDKVIEEVISLLEKEGPTVENDFHRGYIQGNVDGRMSADRSEGTWIYKEYNYTCSNCGNAALEQEDYPYLSSYCPFCGAEMEIEP